MGTYTTNYNLFMPSVGEQGWGELVNGNFTTIDATMKGLNTRMGTAETNITSLTTRMGTAETTITSNKSRIGTLETETATLDGRVTTLEAGEFEIVRATELCGKRVGVPTLTAPKYWSVANTFSKSLTHGTTSSTATVNHNFPLSTTGFEYWDDLQESDESATYTINYTAANYYYLTAIVVTLTSCANGETVTNTFSAGSKSKTYTMSGPCLADVVISTTINQYSYNSDARNTVSISRPAVYIKPKGT